MSRPDAATVRLAEAFREQVRGTLTPLECAWVDATNEDWARSGLHAGACALHELTDGNDCMIDAWLAATGTEWTTDAECDAAWDMAKRDGFGFGRTLGAVDAAGRLCEPLTGEDADRCPLCMAPTEGQDGRDVFAPDQREAASCVCPLCHWPAFDSEGGAL